MLRHQTRHAVAASPAAWLADHTQKWRLEVGQEDRAIARHSAILPEQKQNSKANSRNASAACLLLESERELAKAWSKKAPRVRPGRGGFAAGQIGVPGLGARAAICFRPNFLAMSPIGPRIRATG